jgi:hypothetical protein
MWHFNRFIQTKNVEHLLTLYTKNVILSEIFQKENNAFPTFLYLHLKTLANRAFGGGDTYQGITLTDPTQYQATINAYHWTMQNDNCVLETRVLQSTSRDRTTAEFYIEAVRSSNQPFSAILYHYKFPEKCAIAFDIQNLSNDCDEEEVLILSFTLCKVTSIELKSPDYHITSFVNVLVPETSLEKVPRKLKK